MRFIDIHGHYAWNIDDGMPSKEDCSKALKIAHDQGIEKIIATPHVIPNITSINDLEAIQERIIELKELAKSYSIEVYEGCELLINDSLFDALDHKILLPVENTDYLLVEFDVRNELGKSNEVEDYLYEIAHLGYKIIIAHVERYFHDQIDVERVQSWIDQGYVIQINSTSLLGNQGKHIQKNANLLLEKGMVHAIASDTHRGEGRRIPNLKVVYDLLRKQYDDDTLNLLMYQNPKHILHNEEVENIKIKKSWLQKLFKRGK